MAFCKPRQHPGPRQLAAQAGSVIQHRDVFVHGRRTKEHPSVPPTVRADRISTCAPNHSRLGANPARSPSRPCHEHLGGLLLHSLRKQHLTYTHPPSLPRTGVHSAVPPAAPHAAAPSQGAHRRAGPQRCRSPVDPVPGGETLPVALHKVHVLLGSVEGSPVGEEPVEGCPARGRGG